MRACLEQNGKVSQTELAAAQSEARAHAAAAQRHRAEVVQLRLELEALNRQLEQTCTLRLQPRDVSDSQVLQIILVYCTELQDNNSSLVHLLHTRDSHTLICLLMASAFQSYVQRVSGMDNGERTVG